MSAQSDVSSVGVIACHELVEIWRSRSVIVLGVALTLLTTGAAVLSYARHESESAQRRRYQAVVGQQFADQPDRHPHRVSHYGYLVFRPRAPLGFFDGGIETFGGTSLFLEAHRQNAANFSAAAQTGGSDRFNELTPAAVLQLFVPLFIFVVCGVSVTREREAGTLPLLLCQGTSFSSILWGKLWGTLAAVGGVLVPGLAVSLFGQVLGSDVDVSVDVLVRAMLLALVHVAFLAMCAAVAVMVSAWSATSRGALMTLVAIWFGSWIVVPRVLPAIAMAAYPVPARAAFDTEVEARVKELGDSHNPDDPMFARLRSEALQHYGVSRVEELPFNYGGLVNRESEKHTSDAYREHLDRLLDVYGRQGRLVSLAALVSPYVAMRIASMSLAGADVPHQLEFERQAETFRYALIQGLNELHMNEVAAAQDRYGNIVEGAPTRQRIANDHFDRLPTFEFRPPDVAWALGQQMLGLITGALGAAVALGAFVWTAARRPRVP